MDTGIGAAAKPSVFTQYLATVLVNLISFSYGTAVGWPAHALPKLMNDTTRRVASGPLTEEQGSWLASLFCLVAAVATPAFTWLAGRCNRRLLSLLLMLTFLCSWLLLLFGRSLALLYLGRVLTGVCAGGTLSLAPMYVAEIAQDNMRGALGCIFVLSLNAGILFAYVIGAILSYSMAIVVYLFPPVLFGVTMLFLPHTPVYLLNIGDEDGAKKSLQWFRGKHFDVTEEFKKLKETKEKKKQENSSVSLKDFSQDYIRKGLLITVVLFMNQHLCGIFAILSYTVSIFKTAGSTIPDDLATMIVGLLQLVGTYVSVVAVERLGRRYLLHISNIGMSMFLSVMGFYFYMSESGYDVSSFGWVPILSLSSFVVLFSIGVCPVPFVLVSELFPPHFRGIGANIGFTTMWLLAFCVAKFFPMMQAALSNSGCFWFFSTVCTLGLIFTKMTLPETKGKSIEEILNELKSRKNQENDLVDIHHRPEKDLNNSDRKYNNYDERESHM